MSTSGSVLGDRVSFTGREYEDNLGLYYYRARYYDPNIGRFITRDPIGFASGDVNFYRYVGNGPTTLLDPLGLGAETDDSDQWFGISDKQRLEEWWAATHKALEPFLTGGAYMVVSLGLVNGGAIFVVFGVVGAVETYGASLLAVPAGVTAIYIGLRYTFPLAISSYIEGLNQIPGVNLPQPVADATYPEHTEEVEDLCKSEN